MLLLPEVFTTLWLGPAVLRGGAARHRRGPSRKEPTLAHVASVLQQGLHIPSFAGGTREGTVVSCFDPLRRSSDLLWSVCVVVYCDAVVYCFCRFTSTLMVAGLGSCAVILGSAVPQRPCQQPSTCDHTVGHAGAV